MREKSCCFIGHRTIDKTEDLVGRLKTEIKTLIRFGVTKFLFGSKSDFNFLCHEVITELKKDYPNIIRVAYDTRSEKSVYESEREKNEKIFKSVLNKDIKILGYEEIHSPEKLLSSGKASYIERNEIMIDNSDYCVFYYDKDYKPKIRGKLKRF